MSDESVLAPVLVGAALVSSPALWNVLQGDSPPEVALSRYLVSIMLCWMALAVVAFVVGPVPSVGTPTVPKARRRRRTHGADPRPLTPAGHRCGGSTSVGAARGLRQPTMPATTATPPTSATASSDS